MLKRKVRLKITAASRQTLRLSGRGLKARCPVCGREVEMVTEAEAQVILQVDTLALDGLVDTRQVHALETVSGRLWFCKDSLFIAPP